MSNPRQRPVLPLSTSERALQLQQQEQQQQQQLDLQEKQPKVEARQEAEPIPDPQQQPPQAEVVRQEVEIPQTRQQATAPNEPQVETKSNNGYNIDTDRDIRHINNMGVKRRTTDADSIDEDSDSSGSENIVMNSRRTMVPDPYMMEDTREAGEISDDSPPPRPPNRPPVRPPDLPMTATTTTTTTAERVRENRDDAMMTADYELDIKVDIGNGGGIFMDTDDHGRNHSITFPPDPTHDGYSDTRAHYDQRHESYPDASTSPDASGDIVLSHFAIDDYTKSHHELKQDFKLAIHLNEGCLQWMLGHFSIIVQFNSIEHIWTNRNEHSKERTNINLLLLYPPQFFDNRGPTMIQDFTENKRASTTRHHTGTVNQTNWLHVRNLLNRTPFGERISTSNPGVSLKSPFQKHLQPQWDTQQQAQQDYEHTFPSLGAQQSASQNLRNLYSHSPSKHQQHGPHHANNDHTPKEESGMIGKFLNKIFKSKPDHTSSFVLFAKYFVNKTSADSKEKIELVKIFTSLYDDIEDIVSLNSHQFLAPLSTNQVYPLLALYIMMKIDNNTQGGIQNKPQHFFNLIHQVLSNKVLYLHRDVLDILIKFIGNNLTFKIDKIWHNLIVVLSINSLDLDYDCARNLSETFRRMEPVDFMNDSVTQAYKNIQPRSKPLFLKSFADEFGIFTKDIANPERYKTYFDIYELYLQTTLDPQSISRLLNTISDHVDTISVDALKYRYRLALILMDLEIHNNNRPLYGKLLLQVLKRDFAFFVHEYNHSKKKDMLNACMYGPLESTIKTKGGLLSLMNAIRIPELQGLFIPKLASGFDPTHLNFKEKVKIFEEGSQIPILLKAQNIIIANFASTDLAAFALYCPKYPFRVPDVKANHKSIVSISAQEVDYRSHHQGERLTKESFPVYFEVCKTLIDRYLQTKKSPTPQSFEGFPEKIPVTLPFLLLFNHYLSHINHNTHIKLVPEFGRFATLNIPNNFTNWNPEVKAYYANSSTMQSNLQSRVEQMTKKWERRYESEYSVIAAILTKHFLDRDIPTADKLNEQYNKEIAELNCLIRVGEWLSQRFAYTIQLPDNGSGDMLPAHQIASLKKILTSGIGANGHQVKNLETIRFIGYFITVDYNIFFTIIFNQYAGNNKSIDDIVDKTLGFMKLLINQSNDIPLNDIFKRIIDAKDINYKKELQTIATSLFGVQSNITYLYKFLENNKNIINVANVAKERQEIDRLLAKIDENQMSIQESHTILTDITRRIGGLNFHQLHFFSYIQHEIIEFFASFKDRSGFERTNGIITSNLISDTYNSSLTNNTIHAYNMLEPFTGFYYNAMVRPEGRELKQFKDLTELCTMVNDHIKSYANLDSAFVKIASVIKELPHVKGLYVSAGGTYNSESLLPTVVQLLQGSEFMSRSSKCEEGAVGWNIKIDVNSLYFDQEKIEDFVQGLKISSKDNDQDEKNKAKNKTITTFSNIVNLLRQIHHIHTELDRVYHPEFFSGNIFFKFSEKTINTLEVILSELTGKLEYWIKSIKALPTRLWLLKAHGLSSLISSYVDLTKAKANEKFLDVNELASLLEPFVKYCFQSAEVSRAMIVEVLKDSNTITSKINYHDFLTELISKLEARDDIEDVGTAERGPMMVLLESKNNIYNVLMQLNNSVLPHPSQLFYAHTFFKDIEYFFDTIENMPGKVFFLIGTPKQKERLIHWLSEHYSNQKSHTLARLYIISTEKAVSNDLFSFIPMYNGTFDTVWKNFKDQWTQVKGKGGIAELSLVSSPESGTGKSYFIRSKRTKTNNSITVQIRPNFDSKRLIDHLRYLNSAPASATKTIVMIHFSVSPYCDFDAFNHFIYPLITYGFVFGQRSNEIINIAEKLQLQIYVEIGSPLIDRRSAYPQYTNYLDDTIPLIFHLAEKQSHTDTPWEITETEKKCYSYLKANPYQKPSIEVYKEVKSMATYLEYISHLVGTTFKYHAAFLSNPKYLLQRKNFLKILEERLEFLDAYYNTYSEIGLSDQEFGIQDQRYLLPPNELYQHFVLESIKLSDPAYSSASALWDNPPILTARFTMEQSNLVEIDQMLKGRVNSLKTMDTAVNRQGEFRATIAHAFGITTRTGMIIHLCYQFGYVLTPDFAIRLLFLHNKVKNQRSLVLTGDTGVGKTFILLFYSLLVNAKNNSLPDILFDIKEVINSQIKANPDFILRDIMEDGKEVRRLPGDSSIEMIVKALGQLTDFEPKQPAIEVINVDAIQQPAAAVDPNAGPQIVPPQSNKDFQDALFAKIEGCIEKLIKEYPLIDLPAKSVIRDIKEQRDANMQARVIQKKDKLLQAVAEICSAKFKNLFHRIIMHQKFTSKEFKQNVLTIISESRQLVRIDSNLKMVVFIDEFNTSPNETLSLINEIFIDGTLDGEACIPNNIFWIGAMNPPRKAIESTVDYTGQTTTTSNLSFVVQQPPPSMEQLSLNYGEFAAVNEAPFLDSLFALKKDICPEYQHEELKHFILVGQNALRDAKQNRTHVSIRDITRIIDLYKFFREDPVGVQILMCSYHDIRRDTVVLHWWAMVAAIGLTYYIRVSPGKTRNDLLDKLNSHYQKRAHGSALGVDKFSERFDNLFRKIYTSFCSKKYTNIPVGIALTDSLMQNIFCAVISILSGIPLCVVGPPGCSKTLSFGIVLDNMNANKHSIVAPDDITSPWSLMPNADPFRYQCTPHTTDIEIKDKFEQALTRQGIYDLSGGKSRCVVFFDEAGLVNENDSPMKIMHDYLDKVSQKMDKGSVDISIIILSNKILDAAKTNRMMLLVHPSNITADDEKALVHGCLYNNEQLSYEQEKTCAALCKSYKQANEYTKDTKADLFHQRDFVYFLRHLARGVKLNNNQLTGDVLRNSLERNFGGISQAQFRLLSMEFYKNLESIKELKPAFKRPDDWEHDNTIARIKEALDEELKTNDNPNTCPFRYIMLIDPTENESAIMILKELEVEHTVIRVGGFERDNTTESLVNVVSQIKNVMAEGGTVVLVNTSEIDACFYDVFNRYFTLMPSGTDGAMNFIANVSFGTHSIFCTVHPKFKIIVHLPLSNMGQTQLPWLNRFEKYQLSLDKMVTHTIETNKKLQLRQDYFDRMKASAMHFVKEFHLTVTNKSLLSGFSESETIPSLIFSIAKDLLKNDRPSIEPYRVSTTKLNIDNTQEDMEYRKFNWKLLQIARPESIFKCRSLPKSYIEEYLLRQEHFNILRFLNCLFTQKIVEKNDAISNRWTIYTRTSLTLHRLKDSESMDKFHKILLGEVFKNNKDLEEKVGDNKNILKIVQLSGFNSSAACMYEINAFKTSGQRICMVIADMSVVNQHQINFIIDQFTKFESDKLLITICHYPPEFSLFNKTKLNSIFLNGMEYIYIDSLGVKIDTQLMESSQSKVDADIRTWIAKAYGLRIPIDPISLEESFEQMFFKHLSDIAQTTNNMTGPLIMMMKPKERDFYNNANKRRDLIVELFRAHPAWYKEIVKTFANKWSQKKMFSKIISNISNMILTGKLVHSFIDSIKNSMTSFFYPVISQIFKILTNFQAFGAVAAIEQDDELDKMVCLFIKSVRVPTIAEKIEQRFEPITLSLSPVARKFSTLPVYDSIANLISMLFDQTLTMNANRGIQHIFEKLNETVDAHPIAPLIRFIDESNALSHLYQQDFVQRTMKFTDPQWTYFIINMIKNLFPIKSNSILLYTVSKYFFSNTLNFLKSFVSPLLHLQANVNVFDLFKESLTNEVLCDPANTKTEIASLSLQILHRHIKEIRPDNPDIVEVTADWCSVVREIFDRIPFTQILRQSKKDVTNSIYIHTIYTLCMYVAIRSPEEVDAISLSCVYQSSKLNFDGDHIEAIAKQFDSLNESLEDAGLDQLPVACYLEIIEPLIHCSDVNLTKFLHLANRTTRYFDYDFVENISFGWAAQIIRSNIGQWREKYRSYSNVIFKELGMTTIINPSMKCSTYATGIPSDTILTFLNISKDDFEKVPKNPILADIHYFVALEAFRAEESPILDKIAMWNKQQQADRDDHVARIENLALTTVLIDKLADLINTSTDIAAVKQFLNTNQQFTRLIKTILHVQPNSTHAVQVQKKWFHIYLFNKISGDKTVLQVLRDNEVLTTIGLQEHHIPQDLTLKESSLFNFVIDPSTEDGALYKLIRDAVDAKSLPNVTAVIARSKDSPKSLGFLRMSLFLIVYQYYIEDQNIDFLNTLLTANSATVNSLAAGPYLKFYHKILHKNFNDKVKFDQILMKSANKSKDHFVIAQLMVNFCAVSIGSNKHSYLFNCTANPNAIAGKYFPASEGIFRDCGMVYRINGGADVTASMGGLALHKYIVSSTSWGAFSWSANRGDAAMVAHLTNPAIHFANFLENKTVEGLTDYVNIRALTAISEVSINQEILGKHIEPGHFLTEFVYAIWSQSWVDPKPSMKAAFANMQEVGAYEVYLKKVIIDLLADFENIKRRRNEAILNQSKTLNNISNMRQEYTKTFSSPFYDFEYIHDLIAKEQEQHQLLHFFTTNINVICLSKHFTELIRFLQTFFKHFTRRLPAEFQFKTVPQCIEYIEHENMESKEVIQTISNVWAGVKTSWEHILEHLSIMEGGCRERPQYEKVLQPINDQMPLANLIYVRDLGPGLIIQLVNNWMDNTQVKAIELRSKVPMTSLFTKVIEGLETKPDIADIGDISLDYGDGYMLIGSSFKPADFISFITKCISQYQTFDRQGFQPDLRLIEDKLIARFVSGKISGQQLKHFQVDFPFIHQDNKITPMAIDHKKDHQAQLIPESIKELISIQDTINDVQFNESIHDSQLIPLTNKCRAKLNAEEFESLARYIIFTIARIFNYDGDKDELRSMPISDFSAKMGLTKETVPRTIQPHLDKINISSIKAVSKVIVDGYLSFGYLYSNAIDVPAQPAPEILAFFEQLKVNLILETTESKEVHKWIDYLQEMIFVLSSHEKDLRDISIETRLVEYFDKHLPNMKFPSPSAKYPSYKDLLVDSFPISYYSYFMRNIHEILANIKIKAQDNNTEIYREPYLTQYDDFDGVDEKDAEEEASAAAAAAAEDQEHQPAQDPMQVEDDEQAIEEDDTDLVEATNNKLENYGDNVLDDDVQEESEISDELKSIPRPIKESSNSDYAYIHCLMNWIRFKPENIAALITGKSNDLKAAYKSFKNFSAECLKYSANPIDIDDLLFHIAPAAHSSSGEYLIELLKKLALMDPKDTINKLFNRTVNLVCSNCNKSIQENRYPSLFTYITKDFAHTDAESLIDLLQIANESRTKCPSCDFMGVPKSQLIEAPQYLFVCTPRLGENNKNHSRIAYDKPIELSKYYYSDKKISYAIHSIMCHEDEPGNPKGTYSILIKKKSASGDEQIRCTSKITPIDVEDIDKEHMESNCELLIYEKSLVLNIAQEPIKMDIDPAHAAAAAPAASREDQQQQANVTQQPTIPVTKTRARPSLGNTTADQPPVSVRPPRPTLAAPTGHTNSPDARHVPGYVAKPAESIPLHNLSQAAQIPTPPQSLHNTPVQTTTTTSAPSTPDARHVPGYVAKPIETSPLSESDFLQSSSTPTSPMSMSQELPVNLPSPLRTSGSVTASTIIIPSMTSAANNLTQDDFFSWILSSLPGASEGKNLIVKLLDEKMIDSFGVAFECLDEIKEIVGNKEHKIPVLQKGAIVKMLTALKGQTIPSLRPVLQDTLKDEDFLQWVKTIGFNTKATATVIRLLQENDLTLFSSALFGVEYFDEVFESCPRYGKLLVAELNNHNIIQSSKLHN
eukprot:gene3415-3878_t